MNHRTFFKELFKGQALKLSTLLLIQIFTGISPIIIAWLNGTLIDYIFLTASTTLTKAAIITVVFSATLIVMNDLFGFLHNMCCEYFKDLAYKRIQLKLMHAIASEPTNTIFENPKTNNLISIVKQNIHDISEYISVVSQVITMIFGLIAALMLGFTIVWWVPVVLVLTMVPFIYFRTTTENKIWQAKENYSSIFNQLNLYERILTTADFAKDIRLYSMQQSLLQKWEHLYNQFFKCMNHLRIRSSWLLGLWALLSGAGPLITFFYIAFQAAHGTITLGKVSFLLGVIIQLRGSITCLLYNSADIFRVFLMTKPLLSLLTKNLETFVKNNNINPPDSTLSHFPFSSNIASIPALLRFENVSFSYPGTTENAIKNLSFELVEGQSIAIVGANGSGKSTLLKLICRLYQPTTGKIYWQGQDISSIDFEEYRRLLSVLFQDFAKFPLLVKENIDPKGYAEKEEDLKKVLQKVNLEFLQNKLEMSLSKTTTNSLDLSGGEWQRLAFARMLLNMENSQLVLLDEPTAALDPHSEHEILSLLSQIITVKSSIIIIHRLALCKFVDKIIVMDKGKILEQGSHDQLSNLSAYYHKMFQKQAAWYGN